MARHIPKDQNLKPITCSDSLYGCVDCDIKINLAFYVSLILLM